MSNQKAKSKQSTLTPAFLQAASLNPEGALCSLMLSAFGTTLDSLMAIANQLMAEKDAALIILALTAAVQIRANVVFVGQSYGEIRFKYPALIIEGDREQKDYFNFGALHALGHILAHVSNSPLGAKVIGKAGSCITGEQATTSEAGEINKEIASSWSAEDKSKWGTWLNDARFAHATSIGAVFTTIHSRASEFNKEMASSSTRPGRTTVVAAPRPPAGKSSASTAAPPL